jgi:hypothetical protein
MTETTRIETAQAERPSDSPGAGEAAGAVSLEEVLSYLLATAGVVIGLGGLIIAVVGPQEVWETRLWVIAVAVGLPVGHIAAREQQRRGVTTPMAIALGTIILLVAFSLRWQGSGTTVYNLMLGLAGIAVLAMPYVIQRRFARTTLPGLPEWRVATVAALLVLAIPFLPDSILSSASLFNAALAAGIAFAVVRFAPSRLAGGRLRLALDILLAAALFLLAFHTPNLPANGYVLVHHQDFYLGPVNDVAHGRTALVDVWSQYGVGMVDGLRAAFWIIPIGYGGLVLLMAFATAAQYVLLYTTLRIATGRQLLVLAAMVVSIFCQVFNQPGSYLDYPSTGPLRFGLPYLVVALTVLAARFPSRERALRWASLVVVGAAAVWSFESFVYTIATVTAISLVERLARDERPLRGILRDLGLCVAAAVVGVAGLTLLVAIFAGSPSWSPYVDYIKLYNEGFGALPVILFSTGPLMGTLTILSAAGLGWIALRRRVNIPVPARVALAGFTGFAMSSYTYYLGRSHPSNLVHLLPPVIAYLTVWTSVFLGSERRSVRPAALASAAILLTAGAFMMVNAWPVVRAKWYDSALAQAVPYADGGAPGGGGRSLRQSLKILWDNPVMDPRAEAGVQLIDAHWAPGKPVLALTTADLTTETLMRAERRNLLPISNPLEDDLIDSSRGRVLDAVAHVPAGTLMLLDDPPIGTAGGTAPDFWVPLQAAALTAIRQRFDLRPIQALGGVQVVELVGKGQRPGRK